MRVKLVRCRNCDYTNTEEATVCANCGVPLEHNRGQRPQGRVPRGNQQYQEPMGYPQGEEKEKSHEGFAFFGGLVVGAIICGCVMFAAPKLINTPILADTNKEPVKEETTTEVKAEKVEEEVSESEEKPTIDKQEIDKKPSEDSVVEEPATKDPLVGQELDNLILSKPVDVVVPTAELVPVFTRGAKSELLGLPFAEASTEVDLFDVKIACEDLGVSTYGEKLGIDSEKEVDTFGCIKVDIKNVTSHAIPFKNLMVYLFDEDFKQINITDTRVVSGTTTTTGVFLQDLGESLESGGAITMLIPYSAKYTNGLSYISLVNLDTNGKGTIVRLQK